VVSVLTPFISDLPDVLYKCTVAIPIANALIASNTLGFDQTGGNAVSFKSGTENSELTIKLSRPNSEMIT
jgi:hypothetical protein